MSKGVARGRESEVRRSGPLRGLRIPFTVCVWGITGSCTTSLLRIEPSWYLA
jgi:hypothetical protein